MNYRCQKDSQQQPKRRLFWSARCLTGAKQQAATRASLVCRASPRRPERRSEMFPSPLVEWEAADNRPTFAPLLLSTEGPHGGLPSLHGTL